MIDIQILEKLNAPTAEERLANLKAILPQTKFPPEVPQYINNHIHTTYSFSPYSPTAAVYAARMEGLCTAGIIDHDSIAGAREFLAAAEIIGMPVTIGMECRISMDGTRLEGRRTNNPDQVGVSYMTIQGVPHHQIDRLDQFFRPYREARNRRNRLMIDRINEMLPELALDFDRDVLPLSLGHEGGGVTERHLMYALAIKLTEKVGKGQAMVDKLAAMGLALSDKQKAQMLDLEYPFYEYDLLGILKGAFVPAVYIDATDECPKLPDVVALCKEVDATLCYAYLGDVGNSVTGDKKAQKFEDDYLEDVFLCLQEEGVKAVTYMPTRNTPEQLERLRGMCDQYGMFQISGEDINSPRQGFIIRAMENPLFANLIDATWKLIEHEKNWLKKCPC
ncbi:MAG: PHP domain-containing protein [Oscillospiraceae bacterium]|nr:PHP domain-containing protein [Oscillospiraceae bacterium]